MKKNLWYGMAIVILYGCAEQATKSEQKSDLIPIVSENVVYADSATNQIYQSYQQLKDALVADQLEVSKQHVSELGKLLGLKKGCETTAAAVEIMKSAANLEEIRTAFVAVNTELVPFLKHQPLKSGVLYEQYCPMANGGEGANWVSNSNAVRNPYYGAEMLECGNVVDSLKN